MLLQDDESKIQVLVVFQWSACYVGKWSVMQPSQDTIKECKEQEIGVKKRQFVLQ